ncbi:MAG: CinA family nicotinamide mononucleotide deamidase-related protein [Anaerolineaceae bacterium]|nr:CinA family nicotinamide mononucleotide deamidase-related protein [Anaerolineaceae bacterium]
MPVAEIITIGTELLLGETLDTNTRYLARTLRDAGINLYRTMIVGDNTARIAQMVQEALQRSEIIITTGGLGPTVDDPTREAIAQAIGVQLEFRDELWEQITHRFKRFGRLATENNKRQAYVPAGAIAIENPVGTAPAFIIETGHRSIISLPGVPREMEYLLQNTVMSYLRERFQLRGTIKALVLHAASMGESQIDELIGDLEYLTNPTVGLAAHAGQIDVRVTARAESTEEADRLILRVAEEIRNRLGTNIYGTGEETLASVLQNRLAERGWKLAVVESGIGNQLIECLAKTDANFAGGELINEPLDRLQLQARLQDFQVARQADVALGVTVRPGKDQQDLSMVLITPEGTFEQDRSYGGPPQMAPAWGANMALDWLRRAIE